MSHQNTRGSARTYPRDFTAVPTVRRPHNDDCRITYILTDVSTLDSWPEPHFTSSAHLSGKEVLHFLQASAVERTMDKLMKASVHAAATMCMPFVRFSGIPPR